MTEQQTLISELMETSGVKFGTSGARGLADAMTDRVCYSYTKGFLQYLLEIGDITHGDVVAIAGDFRPSSPRIMAACAQAAEDMGFVPLNCGFIPTPAVALFGIENSVANIMVTGSHIPDDRNGIKFNKPSGEILKQDEDGIAEQVITLDVSIFDKAGQLKNAKTLSVIEKNARTQYIKRYTNCFPENVLRGIKIGVYQHSTVARDVMTEICQALSAEVIPLARSDQFIPVDTEAIRQEDIDLAKHWAAEHQLDCIISADGDGDRPLVSDEKGEWLRGDVAGILCARYLGAKAVATPVSSNSALEKSQWFEHIVRTKIGSPFVIAAMQQLLEQVRGIVVGYEANGGFLLASDVELEQGKVTALPTRDAVIVQLAILTLSKRESKPISQLVADLPPRFTFSDRLKNFPTEISQQRITALSSGVFSQIKTSVEHTLQGFGQLVAVDQTDGLRMTFDNDDILHLRPSGNAPELRCYSESNSVEQAQAINLRCMKILEQWKACCPS